MFHNILPMLLFCGLGFLHSQACTYVLSWLGLQISPTLIPHWLAAYNGVEGGSGKSTGGYFQVCFNLYANVSQKKGIINIRVVHRLILRHCIWPAWCWTLYIHGHNCLINVQNMYVCACVNISLYAVSVNTAATGMAVELFSCKH